LTERVLIVTSKKPANPLKTFALIEAVRETAKTECAKGRFSITFAATAASGFLEITINTLDISYF
jgi:hypothetical protein